MAKLLMKAYRDYLEQRGIKSVLTHLGSANRVFESLIAFCSEQTLNKVVGLRFRGSYKHVIKPLKELVSKRKR